MPARCKTIDRMRSRGCTRSVAVSPVLAKFAEIGDTTRRVRNRAQSAAWLIGNDVYPRAISCVKNLRGNGVYRLRAHRDMVEVAVDHGYERDVFGRQPWRNRSACKPRPRKAITSAAATAKRKTLPRGLRAPSCGRADSRRRRSNAGDGVASGRAAANAAATACACATRSAHSEHHETCRSTLRAASSSRIPSG